MKIKKLQNLKWKKRSMAISVLLIMILIISSTFAWQSISQQAKNEIKGGGVNPGGRLHDDFNGSNKDVYVENFGNQPIFTRVRIDEYFETGEGAGTGTNATPLIAGSSFNDVTTWTPHKPGSTLEDCDQGDGVSDFHDYFRWELGGATTYMPTFNTNKDSLKPDINGTMEGKFGEPYDDYQTYTEGQKVVGTEIWDDDNNDVEDGNVREEEREHTAKKTPVANVMKMKDWDGTLSDTWVMDDDGWAYYAKPIEPGSASGLLLNGIQKKQDLMENWYYGMNVIAQFATAGDWGEDDGTGFFDTSVKGIQEPSANAMKLLNKVAGIYDVTITSATGATSVQAGDTLQLQAAVTIKGDSEVVTNQEVVWEVRAEEGVQTGVTINANGLLTVPADETAKELLVKAKVVNTKAEGLFKITIQTP